MKHKDRTEGEGQTGEIMVCEQKRVRELKKGGRQYDQHEK